MVEDSDIRSVLRKYPLSDSVTFVLMEASSRNENYLLLESSGQKYVLRRYRRNQEPARVDFQLRFQGHLLTHGFPTAPIVSSKDGAVFVMHDSLPWALFEFVEGSEYDFERLDQVAEAARRLAQFHAIADSFVEPAVHLEWEPPPEYYWRQHEKERHRLKELFHNKGVDTEVGYLVHWWEELLRKLPLERYETLPTGWIHGDYHGRNVVFQGEEMKGLFDFDLMTWAPRAMDLGRGLFMFGRERRASRRIRPAAGHIFLDEYSRYRGISAEELQAIPPFLVLNFTPASSWYEYRLRDVAAEPAQLLRDSVGLTEDLETEMRRLAPQFGWTV